MKTCVVIFSVKKKNLIMANECNNAKLYFLWLVCVFYTEDNTG